MLLLFFTFYVSQEELSHFGHGILSDLTVTQRRMEKMSNSCTFPSLFRPTSMLTDKNGHVGSSVQRVKD